MQRVAYPFPLFLDQRGGLLDAGKIYIGMAGDDPEVAPIDVFWDAALTIPAFQPLRTRGGIIVNNGAPSVVYVADTDYSMRVRDADDNQVSYAKAATDVGSSVGISYQPSDATLSALSGLATSAFGRSLLNLTDATALQALLSFAASLPLTGGTVSGNILRQGAGPHLFHNDPAMTSGKVFVTTAATADPTSNPGEIWLKY